MPGLSTKLDFWKRVNKTESCWLWTGAKPQGYGELRVPPGRVMRAHRVAWCLRYGEPPKGTMFTIRTVAGIVVSAKANDKDAATTNQGRSQ